MIRNVRTMQVLEKLLESCREYYSYETPEQSDQAAAVPGTCSRSGSVPASSDKSHRTGDRDDSRSKLSFSDFFSGSSGDCVKKGSHEHDSFNVLSLGGALRLRRMWDFDLSAAQTQFQFQCWRLFLTWIWEGSVKAVSDFRESYLLMLFENVRKNTGANADTREFISTLAGRLSRLPLSGFRIVIDSAACSIAKQSHEFRHEMLSDAEYRDSCRFMQIIYLAVLSSGDRLPLLFGMSDSEYRFLKKLDPDMLVYLIQRDCIHLVQVMTWECFSDYLEISEFQENFPDDDPELKSRGIQHIRTRAMLLASEILGSMTESLSAGNVSEQSPAFDDLKEYRLQDLLCGELVDLNFDTGYICDILRVTNKIVIRRRNLSNGEIGVARRDQWKSMKEAEPVSKTEEMCHRTLLLNSMLAVESVFSAWNESRFLHLRKVVASVELYLMILRGSCRLLAPPEFRDLTLFVRKLSTMSAMDFVSSRDCRLKDLYHQYGKYDFVYPFAFRSDTFSCCFCRKLCRTPARVTVLLVPASSQVSRLKKSASDEVERQGEDTVENSCPKSSPCSSADVSPKGRIPGMNSDIPDKTEPRKMKRKRVGIRFGRAGSPDYEGRG